MTIQSGLDWNGPRDRENLSYRGNHQFLINFICSGGRRQGRQPVNDFGQLFPGWLIRVDLAGMRTKRLAIGSMHWYSLETLHAHAPPEYILDACKCLASKNVA